MDSGQGSGVPRGIEEIPDSIGHPYGERDALPRKLRIGEDVPSTVSALPGFMPIAKFHFKAVIPEIAIFDGTDRTHMKDIGILKGGFSLMDEFAWLKKPLFMDGVEIKSASAMRGNVMSLTKPPTPITGRSSANSVEDLNLHLDSGASKHMVCNASMLINHRAPPAGTDQFMAADGSLMHVAGYGDIEMENFRILDVYHVQGLTVNLISVGQLATNHKVSACFTGNECNLKLSDGRRIGGAIRRDDNQYILRFLEIE
ncbi:uncharacterized protein LOC124700972 [Lolium rigidum]|uniref:uncharacterized protein LOC124700972 n=1 Tax=Lolium rigidum TaxID=89674 RepID=UPI001F5CC37A|nr:uncharacterized protein LOC124700972 [Lolium rigidum]